MTRFIMRATLVVAMVFAGLSVTGCTDFERGLAVGTATGVAGTVAANSISKDEHSTENSMYSRGVRNGCSSAHGRWYKNRYNWRNYSTYRDGWRTGYRRCR